MKTIKCNIHLLSTEKDSRICYLTAKGKEFNDLRLLNIESPIILDSQNFHLYFTIPQQEEIEISKIQKDDWYYSKIHNSLFQCISNKQYFDNNEEKVIATTDRLVIPFNGIKDGVPFPTIYLPSIPEAFIKYFIKEYNKGNIIKTVELNMEEYAIGNYGMCIYKEPTTDFRLKLNNNEVSVVMPVINKKEKTLEYWKANAEEDYITTPISVLRYIGELEKMVNI